MAVDTQVRSSPSGFYTNFAGLRNNVDPDRFNPGDLAVAQNIDIDTSGRMSRRNGYTSVRAGAAHSLWAGGSIALFVSGSQLNQLDASYSASVLRDGLTAGLFMSYVAEGDRIYFTNGEQTGIVENGASRTWGMLVPEMPYPEVTVGNMPAGTYQFTMTYFRRDGQESGASIAGAVTLGDGSGLVFTLPVSTDPDVVSKGVYLSTPNGEVMYLALVLSNDTLSAYYQNDTSELNTPLMNQFMGPPPAGQLIAYYHGRLFVAVDDTLYFSEPYALELFDLRNYMQLDGRISLLATMEDKSGTDSGFFVGTDRSCGVLVGSDPDAFQYIPKTDYGAVIGAIDYVDGSLFGDDSAGARPLPVWLTTQGLCVGMPSLEIKNLTRTRYGFPASGRGAAQFQDGPNRFIAVSNY
jgi:hypothetical protein